MRRWPGLFVAALIAFGVQAPAQVYVQDSPAAAELLNAAEDRLGKEEFDEAARHVQQVFDEHGDKLLEQKEGGYAEARHVGAALLLKNAKLLTTYRQLHEPLAARALKSAGADRTKLGAVLNGYELTDSGLRAAFTAAALDLEAGEGETAAIRLQRASRHPALASQKEQWLKLTAIAAIFNGSQPELEQSRQALGQMNARGSAAEVDRFMSGWKRPAIGGSLDPLDELPAADSPGLLDKPLWTIPLNGAEKFLSETYRTDGAQMDEPAKEGRFLNIMPVVHGGVVYLNDGQSITAIEPSGGLELWRQTVMETGDIKRRYGQPYSRWLPFGIDINCIGVAESRVVGIVGFGAMSSIYPYYRNEADSQLVCLDARTGRREWQFSPEELAEDLRESFWYGRPIVWGGKVYATLRRRQRTQFQDAYVAALDLQTGQMLWRRHLASTAMADKQTVPPLSHLTLHRGWLYVDSALGTVAKLAAVDGSIDWLTTYTLHEDQRASGLDRPWQAGGGVITPMGLVTLDAWSGAIRVVETRQGQLKLNIRADQWGSPEMLAGVDGDVLALGQKLSRRDGRTMNEKWTLDLGSPLRGRGSVAGHRLFQPIKDGVAIVDLDTGKIENKLGMETPANVLALDGQMLMAHRGSVSSYSSWAVASKQLQQRITRMPHDPRPLMALAWLAFSSGNHDSMLAALDKAIELVAQDKQARATAHELFTRLLSMAEDGDKADPPLRAQLYDRLASVAAGGEDEVAYHLSYGRFLESVKRMEEAVQQYQTVLAEPGFRRRLYNHESGSRQAGLEAQRLLQLLINKQGPQLYAKYEAFALRRLEELTDQADPAPLVELAEAYPLASVAPKALQQAAERTASSGNVRDGVALLRHAAQLTRDPRLLAAIYGRQADMLEDSRQPQRARGLLRQLSAMYPEIQPLRKGQPIAVTQWISLLSSQPAGRGGVSRLALPLNPRAMQMPGGLLTPIAQDLEATPLADLLIRGADKLELRKPADGTVIWSKPVETPDVRLLSADRGRIWLWSASTGKLQMLDAADGSIRWEDASIRTKLGQMQAEGGDAKADMNAGQARIIRQPGGGQIIIKNGGGMIQINGQAQIRGGLIIRNNGIGAVQINANGLNVDGVINAQAAETMFAVNDNAVGISDPEGRLIVLNGDNGKVRWQLTSPVRHATRLVMNSQFVITSGADEEDAPLLCVYDAQTGQLAHRLMNPKRQNIYWMGVSDEGLLVYVSATQVEAFDLNRGRSTWICKPGVQLMGQEASWMGVDRLAVRTADNDLLWLDMSDGRVVGRMPVRQEMQNQWMMSLDADAWFLIGNHFSMNRPMAQAMGNDGKLAWRDGVTEAGQMLDAVLTDKHVAMLVSPLDPQGPTAEVHPRRVYLLDRATGAIREQYVLSPSEPLDHLSIQDGRLLISGQRLTAVIQGGK